MRRDYGCLDSPDPIIGAMIVAKSHGELTPGDCLRVGLLPLGWEHGNGLPSTGVRMSDRMPERIAKARADIEEWNRCQIVTRLVAVVTRRQVNLFRETLQ